MKGIDSSVENGSMCAWSSLGMQSELRFMTWTWEFVGRKFGS